jgi:hypothetical protein
MSQDFKKVLVKDSRLMVTDSINYAVFKGGQNMTVAKFNAISKSSSQLTFNIQVPSEQTIIDRRVMLHSTWQIQITGNVPSIGDYLINVGSQDALAPFPAHQLFSTAQITLNNNTVSMNVQDVINAIMRSNDSRELQAYNGMCPVAFDTYLNYSDAVLANNNPLGSYVNVSDNDIQPRGAFYIDSITGNTAAATAGEAKTVVIQFSTAEPLLVSPFIFADPKSNNQGIYGIQNLNAVFNVGSANRVWRSANPNITGVSLVSCQKAELVFNFITGHPSDLMSARNVVPYYELPRYISQVGSVGVGSQTLPFNSIQLNQVPDKLIVFCRKQLAYQTANDADAFLPITGIRLNWNNQSGILASATAQDLFRYSRESGYNGTWNEFNGSAWRNAPAGGSGSEVLTTGSMLMLTFGEHIQITEDWYAPGSLGNFNLQFDVEVENKTGAALANYEIVLITVNSGCFVCERGTSSIYTGILTRQDVLEASQMEAYGKDDVKRMIGGGWFDVLKSVAGKVLPKVLPVAKGLLKESDNKFAKMGAEALGAMGYGSSGGKLSKRLM